MALIVDKHPQEGGSHRGVVAAGETGIHTFSVSPGRRYNMVVSGNTGGTFNVGFYLFSADDDKADKMTRFWARDLVGVTDTYKIAASVIGMMEIGIEITAASSSDITVELRECKL